MFYYLLFHETENAKPIDIWSYTKDQRLAGNRTQDFFSASQIRLPFFKFKISLSVLLIFFIYILKQIMKSINE